MFFAASRGAIRYGILAGTLSYLGLLLPATVYAQNNSSQNGSLSPSQVEEFTKKLTPDAVKDLKLAPALKLLREALVVNEQSFSDALTAASSFLEKNKDKLDQPAIVMGGTRRVMENVAPVIKRFSKKNLAPTRFVELWAQIEASANVASDIEVHLDRDAAAIRQMKVLKQTIADPKQLDLSSHDLHEAGLALAEALADVAPGQFRINILGAWYGDLRLIKGHEDRLLNAPFADGWRVCSATRVVRTHCQGRESCPFQGDGTKPKLDVSWENLCGFSPAPFADFAVKGLVVRFECIPLLSSLWSKASADPPKQLLVSKEPNEALFRMTAKAELRCQPAKLEQVKAE